MQSLHYQRHFLTLIPAAMLLWLITTVEDAVPPSTGRWVLFFGAMGALHSASLVLSLRDKSAIAPAKAIIFITLVSAVSVFAPFTPLFSLALTPFGGDSPRLLFALTFASAFGASAYWLLLRFFWLRSLRFANLATTIAMCCSATLLGWFGAAWLASGQPLSTPGRSQILRRFLAWWVAFSLSLYCGDAQWRIGRSLSAIQ
jgi:hypothetical protein